MFLFLLLVLGVSCTLYALGCLSSSLSLIYLCAFAYKKKIKNWERALEAIMF